MRSDIRVLIVDDSAFIRNAISNMLSKSTEIEVVGFARDGEEALAKVEKLSPDVMTLDVEMPKMNGLEVLSSVMTHHPLPVIMVSSLTEESASETLDALDLGAVDYISKQLNGSVLEIAKIETLLISKVKAAATAKVPKRGIVKKPSRQKTDWNDSSSIPTRSSSLLGSEENVKNEEAADTVVIIGSSTGGPTVIQEMLETVPSFLSAAVIIVQHMPKYFTKPFSERLNQLCAVPVKEAKDRDPLLRGQVLVAPGGQHLQLEVLGVGKRSVRVSREPVNLPYRPSVDLAMESAAQIFGSAVIGVILTGMGNDGERGMQAVKVAGGYTIAQNEESCVIYGMPKASIDAGHVDAVMPISRIKYEILHRIALVKERGAESSG